MDCQRSSERLAKQRRINSSCSDVTSGANALTVEGRDVDDTIDVSPQTATDVTLQANGDAPVVTSDLGAEGALRIGNGHKRNLVLPPVCLHPYRLVRGDRYDGSAQDRVPTRRGPQEA